MYKLNYIFLLIIICTATLIGSIKVNGTVVDKSDQIPIIDANVTAGGKGTATDKYGKFQIHTDSKVLFIDHIGYDKITIQVADSLHIEMVRSILKNEEIIVLSSFKSGYVRKTCYDREYQINKVKKTSKFHKYTNQHNGYYKIDHYERILIPNELDRLEYLVKFAVKNYYIKPVIKTKTEEKRVDFEK